MVESNAGSQSLVGGVLALDFVNTASGRDTPEPIELLRLPAHVIDWAMHVGSIDAATAGRCRAAIEDDRNEGKALLRHARALREALYAIAAALARNATPPEAHLGMLRTFARRVIASAALAPVPSGGYAFDFRAGSAEAAVLGPVVWSALDLLANKDFRRVKECPECGWLFFDHSKNNSRRWCEMATCGNRIKARRHRGRRR